MVVCGVLAVLLSLLLCGEVQASSIKLSAFNVQVFGITKFGKPEVVDILSKVRV